MGCSNDDSFLNKVFEPRKQFPLEHRPRMLKDFLTEDSYASSSTGFKSFPRKPINSSSSTITTLCDDPNNKSSLIRTGHRSETASSPAISPFQAMIIAVKKIHFITAVKSPSILPRSLLRRLSSKKSTYRGIHENKKGAETKVTVTIKDIIRWKSFRDIVEEKSQSSDLPSSSPHHYTTTTTTTVSTASSPCSRSSNGSSWCDSDFTAEYLPCWHGESEKFCENEEVKVGKKHLPRVGEKLMEAATIDKIEERQQNSPVSVINIEFEEDDDDEESKSFQRSKRKLMQKIRRYESRGRLDTINLENWMSMEESTSSGEDEEEEETETNGRIDEEVEEKARQLLNHVKETSSLGEYRKENVERVVLDFFRDELCRKRYGNGSRNDEMLRRVKCWMDGEQSTWTGWEKKEACVRDMETEGKWSKFEEEQQELVSAIENGMMGFLVDELLIDLIS
eukprot:XP_015583944.1 uncharacterized protein LOC8258504 [Ricinus communis]